MTTHIHEDETGVCFSVQYHDDGQGVIFTDVHVLDKNYLPVGPNLQELLHKLVLVSTNAQSGDVTGTRFLSTIVEEIKS